MSVTPKRRLMKVDVSFISLVGKGANQKTVIWKSAEAAEPTIQKQISIAKVDEEERMVFGIVYSPDQVDSQGDVADAAVIKEMAYNFQKSAQTGNIDKQHNFSAGEGFVAESWLTKAGDPLFPNDPVGSWAVGIKVEKDETWEAVKKGELAGLSMAGLALCEEVQKSAAPATTTTDKPVTMIDKVKKKLGISIKKDFTEVNQMNQIMRMTYTLEDVIRQIYDDATILDKKAAILGSIEQYKNAVEVQKSGVEIEKAGKAISSKNMSKIKDALKALTDLLSEVETEESVPTTKSSTTTKSEEEMTPEETKELVKSAMAEAMKPLQDEIAALKKSAEEGQKAINDRVEKIEKSTPGSQQKEQPSGNSGSTMFL